MGTIVVPIHPVSKMNRVTTTEGLSWIRPKTFVAWLRISWTHIRISDV